MHNLVIQRIASTCLPSWAKLHWAWHQIHCAYRTAAVGSSRCIEAQLRNSAKTANWLLYNVWRNQMSKTPIDHLGQSIPQLSLRTDGDPMAKTPTGMPALVIHPKLPPRVLSTSTCGTFQDLIIQAIPLCSSTDLCHRLVRTNSRLHMPLQRHLPELAI